MPPGGFEKPLWFQTDTVRSETLSWSHSEAHPVVGEECRAVQQAAGVIDISGSAKYEISGADATAFLEHLSCNRLPGVGRIGLVDFDRGDGFSVHDGLERIDFGELGSLRIG